VTRRTTQNNACTGAGAKISGHEGNYTPSRVCKRPGCRRPFTPLKRWQVFCSPGCHDAYWREIRQKASEMAAGEGKRDPL
jgi:hypothetical protein